MALDTNSFFGLAIDSQALGGKIIVLLLAVVLGGAIGLERQLKGTAAGLRTHILVCVGATLITLTSVALGYSTTNGVHDEPGRIIAQIVSGIGFLGAGAILREGWSVHGLTTAASIWITAAIGIAIGASPHLGELGVVTTVIVLFTLIVLRLIEPRLPLPDSYQTLNLEFVEGGGIVRQVLNTLEQMGIVVVGMKMAAGEVSPSMGTDKIQSLQLQIVIPPKVNRGALTASLTDETKILSFQLN